MLSWVVNSLQLVGEWKAWLGNQSDKGKYNGPHDNCLFLVEILQTITDFRLRKTIFLSGLQQDTLGGEAKTSQEKDSRLAANRISLCGRNFSATEPTGLHKREALYLSEMTSARPHISSNGVHHIAKESSVSYVKTPTSLNIFPHPLSACEHRCILEPWHSARFGDSDLYLLTFFF